jgi:hypothetical protein
MRDQKGLLLLIPMITAMLFIVDYSFLFSYGYAERQSQSTNTICYGRDNSCYTTFCSDYHPCQTLSSNQPDEEATVMQPDEEATVMQPDEEATVMQPDEEATVMQPVEVTEEYVDATLEDCDDGLDNDVDGKVDVIDEECNVNPSQLDNYGFGRSAQDDGQNESNDDDDGVDNKDEYNEQEESEDNN